MLCYIFYCKTHTLQIVMIRFHGFSLPQTRGNVVRALSTAAEAIKKSQRVVIQPAIKRGPTDLLKALSDTVGVDPTAPHFAFIDDPATIPSTAQNMRHYFMSKEMGKRAARQLAQEWPTLFAFDRDQPRLPVFRPEKSLDPLKVDPTESNLLQMIEKREVQDAAMMYERMRADNLDVSEKVQLELFRLVAYYNGKNPPYGELEEWHGLRNFGNVDPSEWTEAGIADLLFETLPRNADTVSTLICGLCKHSTPNSVARANELFHEHSSLSLTRDVYESLITVSNWGSAQKIANAMKKGGHSPSVRTFNCLLICVNKTLKDKKDRQAAIQSVMAEMKRLRISPTLETLHLVLDHMVDWRAFDEANSSGKEAPNMDKSIRLCVSWLAQSISLLESQTDINLTSAYDHAFFNTAMNIARGSANLALAERIVSLYESSKNHVKMPAFTLETKFYNTYLLLFIEQTPSIKDIDAKYRSIVPRCVGVNRMSAYALSDKLEKSPFWPLLLRLIEDGISSKQMIDHRLTQMFRERLMQVQYESLSVTERDEFSRLVRRMVDIWTEFSRFTEERLKRHQIKMSPSMVAESAVLLNRIGDSDRAYGLLEMLLSQEATQGEEATIMSTGFARPSAMAELFEDALRQGDAVKSATCLEIMASNTPRNKLEVMAQRIHDRCTVTEAQSRLINVFVRLRPQ